MPPENQVAVGGSSPFRIPLPERRLNESPVSRAGLVGIQLTAEKTVPQIELVPEDESPLTRKISTRINESGPNITLPKVLIESLGYQGDTFDLLADDDGLRLIASANAGHDDPDIRATEAAFLSKQRGSKFEARVPESVAPPAPARGDSVQLRIGAYSSRIMLALDFRASRGEDGVDITLDPNTGREEQARVSFYVPSVIGKALQLGGARIMWGGVRGKHRVVGFEN